MKQCPYVTSYPNVFVVGDEQGDEVILGRDILNRLTFLLDGPAALTTLR